MADGWLTTRHCADLIGVSTDFVRGEIQDGRLVGTVIARDVLPGRKRARALYRVAPRDFVAYCQRYCPSALSRLPPAA